MENDEDYFFYGQPLEEEVESKGQYAMAVQDASQTKSLPVWQQEVTDAQGRRRFHGAFTGGYSAGFFNTVGSLEGFTPSQFKSNRGDRAQAESRTAQDFMDEDELAELQRQNVHASADYDTFGSAAAESAKRLAQGAAQDHNAKVPSLVPEELIVPVPESVGVKLLQSMGWRQSKGLGTRGGEDDSAVGKGRRGWGKVAGVGVENTPIYALPPKTDQHGLGFDPFKDAEVFRKAKQGRDEPQQPSAKRTHGVAFGSGAGDEDDVYGMTDDYVTTGTGMEGMAFEIASDEEDDLPIRQGGRLNADYLLPGRAQPLPLQSTQQKQQAARRADIIPGFIAAESPIAPVYHTPPVVPASFRPFHEFLEDKEGAREPSPKEAAPPADGLLHRAIDAVTPQIARLGPSFERLLQQQHADNPAFAFLRSGPGADYYKWRLHQLKQKGSSTLQDQGMLSLARRSAPLTADDRAVLLGEAQLPTAPAPPHMAARGGTQQKAAHPIAETDMDRLKAALAGNFTRGTKQDLGFGGADESKGGLMPPPAQQQSQQPGPGAAAAAAAAAMAARFTKEHEQESAVVNAAVRVISQ
ncbi:hypothetical protein WJX73_006570 [Symbiochloris irregularis]|uniref:G-patch domain-containing protein n=1 Tax=Symbiochloris irregularis TaxID=706552 RepID=A0AAW1NVG2_9CHLO